LSTESIAGPSGAAALPAAHCLGCGRPLAGDQRYCLECGARSPQVSGVLSGDLRALVSAKQPPQEAVADSSNGTAGANDAGYARASNTTAVIAGVGVLLLAMGVGVLIGRSSISKQAAAPAEVVSVSPPGTATGATTTPSATTTPTVTTPEASSKSSSAPFKQSSKKATSGSGGSKGSGSGGKTGSGSTKSGSGESGASYEQKSKNLPNVISTG
jgi:hypothetical protein